VINGLMQRSDWAAAIRMPIGHVPGGSGNGLATSILKACGEEYGVVEAGFVVSPTLNSGRERSFGSGRELSVGSQAAAASRC